MSKAEEFLSPRLRLLAFVMTAMQALPALADADKSGPIQDNSFLLEEAYNQEAGVVQHISTFQRSRRTKDWAYTFTQEWPIGSQTHQFSYTLPILHERDLPSGRTGVGDAAINYRFQWIGDGNSSLAIAPRASLVLPTGDWKNGRGTGATGLQLQLPVSGVVSERLVSHTNLGWTITPRARDAQGQRADLRAVNIGQSFVWLATDRLNVMLEWVHVRGQVVAGNDAVAKERSTFLSPGLRWAYNLQSGMQIVPGIAVPIGIGPSRRDTSILLYLSFEHPY